MFFKHAKASLSAIKNNIKDIKNKSVVLKRNSTGRIVKNPFQSKSQTKTLDDETFARVEELHSIITNTNNDMSKYHQYEKARNELARIIGAGPKDLIFWNEPMKQFTLIGADGSRTEKFNTVMYSLLKDDGKQMRLLKNTQLFHTSSNPNLKVLSPRYYYNDGSSFFRLWATPRVYFGIGNAIGRDGTKFNGVDVCSGEASYKYTPASPITKYYVDNEMGSDIAIFVETMKDIPVIKC